MNPPACSALTDKPPWRRSSADKDFLHPPQSPYPAHVDPSPVESQTSESTDTTDIEQEVGEGIEDEVKSPDIEISSPQSAGASGHESVCCLSSVQT